MSVGKEVVPSKPWYLDIPKCHAGISESPRPTELIVESIRKGRKQEETEMSKAMELWCSKSHDLMLLAHYKNWQKVWLYSNKSV